MLPAQAARLANSFAWVRSGNRIATNSEIMPITTTYSMR